MNKKPLSMRNPKLVTNVALDNQEIVINEKNAQWALQITRWHLELLGIGPLSSKPSYYEKIFTYSMITVCSFLLIFDLVPSFLYIYVKVKDPLARIKLAAASSFCVMAIMKYCSLLSRHREIADCIKHLIDDWKRSISVNDRVIMINCAKYGRWGSIVCAICMYSGGIFYSGILPCVTPSIKDDNNDTIKPLAYPGYYVWFDEQESVTYIVVFFIQSCCAVAMLGTTCLGCNIALVFSMHACGQLRILTSPLNDFINGTTKYKRFDDILLQFIQQHTRTLRFINNIEEILNKVCLVEVVGCTMVICLLEYYIMLEWENSDSIAMITYSTLLTSLIFNIFLFSYVGNLLTDEQCRKVGDSLYMIDWYKLSPKNTRQLTLILLIAQNPATITAGKIIHLSLVTFASVIRTSVTYLNLLRQVIH